MEKFDPSKFKTIEDIPKKIQKNFMKVSDNGSFIRKEASESDEWAAERADRINKAEDNLNTKVEAVDLIHEQALKEHAKIEEKFSEKISGLEEKLEIGLSEDSKKKIYSQISAEHRDKTMSAQERGDRYDEQEIYNNEQILIKSKEILEMPEEDLLRLSEEQRRKMIRNLKWNRFADRFDNNETPEEVLDAESKIYKTYKPSMELQAIHAEKGDALLETVSKDFARLNGEWNAAPIDKRLEMCQFWADQLADGYKIPRARLYSSDQVTGGIAAAFEKSTDANEPSTIALSEEKLKQGNMRGWLHNIRHEMTHAFPINQRKYWMFSQMTSSG